MAHQKKSVSLSSTEKALTDILNYPILSATPKSRAKKSNGPHVLTSSKAIAMIEQSKNRRRSRKLKSYGKKCMKRRSSKERRRFEKRKKAKERSQTKKESQRKVA